MNQLTSRVNNESKVCFSERDCIQFWRQTSVISSFAFYQISAFLLYKWCW